MVTKFGADGRCDEPCCWRRRRDTSFSGDEATSKKFWMLTSTSFLQTIYNSATPGYPDKGKRYVCWARSQVLCLSAVKHLVPARVAGMRC